MKYLIVEGRLGRCRDCGTVVDEGQVVLETAAGAVHVVCSRSEEVMNYGFDG